MLRFCPVRGRGLDGHGGIVVVVILGNLHEVAVDEAAQRLDIPGVHFRALDLVSVIVDPDKAGPVLAGQSTHRPAYPAPHIEHLHPRSQGQPIGKKTLVPEQRRLEALAPPLGAKCQDCPQPNS